MGHSHSASPPGEPVAGSPRAAPTDAQGRSLFVGLFPAPRIAATLAQHGAGIVDGLGLRTSRVIRPERLHLTLHFLGRFAEAPHEVVERVVRAVARVQLGALEVSFDAAQGFGGGVALGLCAGPDDNRTARALRGRLGEAFEWAGVASDPRFDPHMTVAYLAARFGRASIEPLKWPAGELRLAFMVGGQRTYDTLAHWPLEPSR